MIQDIIMEFREILDNEGPLYLPWCSTFKLGEINDLNNPSVALLVEQFVDSFNENERLYRIHKPDTGLLNYQQCWGVPIVFPHLRIVVVSVTCRNWYSEYKADFDVLHSPEAGEWKRFDLTNVLVNCPSTERNMSKYFCEHVNVPHGLGSGIYSLVMYHVLVALQYMEDYVCGHKK